MLDSRLCLGSPALCIRLLVTVALVATASHMVVVPAKAQARSPNQQVPAPPIHTSPPIRVPTEGPSNQQRGAFLLLVVVDVINVLQFPKNTCPLRVDEPGWVVAGVTVQVWPIDETDGVLADEPAWVR